MTDEDDFDPEDPTPSGHYIQFRDNEWRYVPEELTQTISLGPSGNGKEVKTGCSRTRLKSEIQATARRCWFD